MKTIWKYTITDKEQTLEVPANSKILSSGMQNDVFCIWFCVDKTAKKEKRTFLAVPTGLDFTDSIGLNLIGRTDYQNGLVFHIFEVTF